MTRSDGVDLGPAAEHAGEVELPAGAPPHPFEPAPLAHLEDMSVNVAAGLDNTRQNVRAR